MERALLFIDRLNTLIGRTFAWCESWRWSFVVSYEVFSRYLFQAPTKWAFDAS